MVTLQQISGVLGGGLDQAILLFVGSNRSISTLLSSNGADKNWVMGHVKLSHKITSCKWDDSAKKW